MKRSLENAVASFGQLLDVSPRPSSSALERLQRVRAEMAQRTDASMLRRDFEVIGKDMQKAIENKE